MFSNLDKQLVKSRLLSWPKWSWIAFSFSVATALPIGLSLKPAQAEGSRDLYPAGATGFRANTEWRTSDYFPGSGNPLKRRTLLNVYANAGEVILLGSSAVRVGDGDIQVYNPDRVTGDVGQEIIPPVADFTCSQQNGNPNRGRITSRLQETTGPALLGDAQGNPLPGNGYIPCYYVAPVSGIYNVAFYGPLGANSDEEGNRPTGQITLNSGNNFNAQQATSIAAWDVTVRPSITANQEFTGRLFSYYLTLFAGANLRPVNSTVYALTTDGFIYQTELNGIDPNGFVLYGNRAGFLDPDGATPLNHDLVSSANSLINPEGGVKIARPEFPIFFNRPDSQAISAIDPPNPNIPGAIDVQLGGIPLTPIVPTVSSFGFAGTVGDSTSLVNTGGTFSYIANTNHTFEVVISRDGVNFDPTNPNNRVIRALKGAGLQTIVWDGKDNSGQPFPVNPPNQPYRAKIQTQAGLYHFPLLDVENSSGGPWLTLINPPNGQCQPLSNCRGGFYDDRGYRTTSGVQVDTAPTGAPTPPSPPFSRADNGEFGPFDTSSNQRNFTGFGNTKGLDLWTYYPSNEEFVSLNIIAPRPTVNKSVRFLRDNDGTNTLTVGDDVEYKVIVQNPTSQPITGLVISDTVPTQVQVLRDGSNPITVDSGFSLAPTLPSSNFNGTGAPVTFTAPGTLAVDTTATLTFNARIQPNAANPIANQSSVRFDGDGGTPLLSDASDSRTPTAPGSNVNPGIPEDFGSGGNVNQPNDSPTDLTTLLFATPVTPAGSKAVSLVTDADNSGDVTTGDTLEYEITYINSDPTGLVTNFLATDTISSEQLTFVDGSYTFQAFNGAGGGNTTTTITQNPSFNGTTDINLTNPTNRGQLGVNFGRVVITFRVVVKAGAGESIPNQAIATSTGGSVENSVTTPTFGPGQIPQKPDNNGDGDPTNDPTVVNVGGAGGRNLRLLKRITNITRAGVPISGINFDAFTPDPNDENDTAPGWAQLPGGSPVGVFDIGTEASLQSGDDVEYTVYFLSDGTQPAPAINVCDPIPEGTLFIPGSISLTLPSAGLAIQPQTDALNDDRASFIPSLNVSSPYSSPPCPNPNNPTGAVFVDLGTIPNTAPNNVGFLRFRVKIE